MVAEQAKCESCLPKEQAGIEAFLSPGLSPLTSEIREQRYKMQEKFLKHKIILLLMSSKNVFHVNGDTIGFHPESRI